MPIPRFRTRTLLAGVGSCLAFWLAGCLFDSKYPDPDEGQSFSTVVLDTLYPASAAADSTVSLYQPILDISLGTGNQSAPEILKPVNVKDHATGKVVRYQVTRQGYGAWNGDLEFKWNWFLLQSTFLFSGSLPDTAGMNGSSATLFQRVHALDSFTNYFDSLAAPRIWARINTSTKPGAVGVAVKLSGGGDTVLIQQVIADSPAGRAGLQVGMAILAVNDSSIVGDSAIERFQRFSAGDSGAAVKLTLSGPGTQGAKTFNLVREPVAFPTVTVDSIQGIGYLYIGSFTPNTIGSKSTHTELVDGLIATRKFPVTILDLRDNGGGSLDEAFRMCDEILPADSIIIRQLQRRYDESAHAPVAAEIIVRAGSGGVGEKAADGSRRKYLLLGNAHSASASEIFLVSLREGAGAPLMGVKTYGKGVGQTVRNTPGQGLSLITFLKFTSRKKLDYHLSGLVPDIVDSSASDSLLAHAAQRAMAMAAGPAAKISTAAGKGLQRTAASVEWNRRQAIRPAPLEWEARP
jgi:C-terminal peptidase prc